MIYKLRWNAQKEICCKLSNAIIIPTIVDELSGQGGYKKPTKFLTNKTIIYFFKTKE